MYGSLGTALVWFFSTRDPPKKFNWEVTLQNIEKNQKYFRGVKVGGFHQKLSPRQVRTRNSPKNVTPYPTPWKIGRKNDVTNRIEVCSNHDINQKLLPSSSCGRDYSVIRDDYLFRERSKKLGGTAIRFNQLVLPSFLRWAVFF